MATRRLTAFLLGACAALVFGAAPAAAAIVQQAKLTAADEIGADARLGNSVAISSDGDTAIVGGWTDNSKAGAAWVYVRSGTSWREQQKLTVSDGTANQRFGESVALSADGNTALISAPDYATTGAVWIFVRSATTGTWSEQQMIKSVGGTSVALSADGNTALIGDTALGSDFTGGAYVYTRSGALWSKLGSTLAPNDADPNGLAHFGGSVALSGDGNTALIGGNEDGFGSSEGATDPGAAWIFTRGSSGFSQDGSKIVPNDEGSLDYAAFGGSVSLSSDGSIALIGGAGEGYAWVYTRSGSSYSELDRLSGSDATSASLFGASVSLSSDGDTALIGGYSDGPATANATYPGAAWEFSRQGSTFVQDGPKTVPAGDTGSEFGYSVALAGDSNTALIGGETDGAYSPPDMSAPTFLGAAWVYVSPPTASTIEPGSGPTAGGTSIVIVGDNFTGTSSVTIGGKPASFRVGDSQTLIVTSPPGSGKEPIVVTTAATSATVGTFTYIPPTPVLTKLKQSHKTWQRGSKLASISRAKKKKPPVGTTFSFTLSEAATVQLAFAHGKHSAGTLKLSARAGKDKIAFYGKLSKSKKLKSGSYTVTISATLDGESSRQSRLTFKIVSG
jgi:FG-GAP repeat/IPT/TIG domain